MPQHHLKVHPCFGVQVTHAHVLMPDPPRDCGVYGTRSHGLPRVVSRRHLLTGAGPVPLSLVAIKAQFLVVCPISLPIFRLHCTVLQRDLRGIISATCSSMMLSSCFILVPYLALSVAVFPRHFFFAAVCTFFPTQYPIMLLPCVP